jgi:hypothetical protein
MRFLGRKPRKINLTRKSSGEKGVVAAAAGPGADQARAETPDHSGDSSVVSIGERKFPFLDGRE